MSSNTKRCCPRRVGLKLAQMRRDCGLTQSGLADRVSETTTLLWEAGTVSRLERGMNGQSLRLLAVCCDAMGTDIKELLS